MNDTLREPFLDTPRPVPSFPVAILTVCLLSSAVGMVFLKCAQFYDRPWLFVPGYALEAVAFGLYPLSLRTLSLTVVIVAWSATSNVVAFSSSVVLFNEPFSWLRFMGCVCNIVGVVVVASA